MGFNERVTRSPRSADYRKITGISDLRKPEYAHTLLLLFWPVYGMAFLYLERLRPGVVYQPVKCALDDMIPFNEWFYIPYMLWFAYLALTLLYGFLRDIDAFRREMYFIMFTCSAAIITYFIWPTMQELRPRGLESDNILKALVAGLYDFDTSTNVCPSIHVLGAAAGMLALIDMPVFRKPALLVPLLTLGALIAVSTVFMKQHSSLDVAAALPLSAAGALICYPRGALRL